MDRERIILRIVMALRSPLVMLSKPSREEIFALAEEHKITAIELLQAVYKRALSA